MSPADATIAVSRRERKKLATRRALHVAAMELTEQLGLAAVTIDAITDRADVAPRTFFNYYSCKEDAVLGHDPEHLERSQAHLRERPAGEGPLTALGTVLVEDLVARDVAPDKLLRLVRLIKAEPQLRAAQAARWEEVERAMVAVVAERCGLDAGEDMYPTLVVGAAGAAVRASVMRWCDQGGRVPLGDLVGSAIEQLVAGLDRRLSGR